MRPSLVPQATSYRGLVYMAGVIPLDPPTMMIAGGEITAQVLRAMASCEAVAIAQRSTVVGAALGLTVYLSLAAGTGAGAAGGSGGGAGGGSCGCGDRSSGGGAEARALARSAVEALLEVSGNWQMVGGAHSHYPCTVCAPSPKLPCGIDVSATICFQLADEHGPNSLLPPQHGLPGYPQPSHRASVPSAGSSGNGMGLSLSGGGARPAAPRFGRSNTFGSGATPTAAKGQYGSATGMAVLSRRVVLGADGLDEDEEERAAAAAAGEDEGPGLEAVLDRYLQPPEVRLGRVLGCWVARAVAHGGCCGQEPCWSVCGCAGVNVGGGCGVLRNANEVETVVARCLHSRRLRRCAAPCGPACCTWWCRRCPAARWWRSSRCASRLRRWPSHAA